jgi:hypothetical protein
MQRMSHRDTGFTGTQRGMTDPQKATVFRLLQESIAGGAYRFHHGDCIGADSQAHDIAREVGMHVIVHPPEIATKRAFCVYPDEIRPKKPYLERNHDICDECDVLIAAPSGPEQLRSGTWATVRYAVKQGLTVYIIKPDGSVENR